MRLKSFIKYTMILTLLLMSFSISYAELYSGGPWRGRVVDADTKEPIEGAVVVAVWEREYDGHPAGTKSFFHDAKETLTDKDGRFEIPAYIVKSEDKNLLRKKDTEGAGLMKLILTGPAVREPTFIVYKPSYGNYPHQDELIIYPVEDGSKVEYQEFHKEIVKGQEIEWGKKRSKTFPEGLVYCGAKCKSRIDALGKTLPYEFGSFFIPMEKAKERIERLNVPLDCPANGEPIPGSMHGFRDDIVMPLHGNKGGFVIIELPKVKTWIERIKSHEGAYVDSDIPKTMLPNLRRILGEEDNYLKPMYKYNREKLNIPIDSKPK